MPSPHALRFEVDQHQSALSQASGFWQQLLRGHLQEALVDAHPGFEWLGKELDSDDTAQEKLSGMLQNKSVCRPRLVPPALLSACEEHGEPSLTGGDLTKGQVAVAVDVVDNKRTVTFGTVVERHQKSWRVVRVFDPMPLAIATRSLCNQVENQIENQIVSRP